MICLPDSVNENPATYNLFMADRSLVKRLDTAFTDRYLLSCRTISNNDLPSLSSSEVDSLLIKATVSSSCYRPARKNSNRQHNNAKELDNDENAEASLRSSISTVSTEDSYSDTEATSQRNGPRRRRRATATSLVDLDPTRSATYTRRHSAPDHGQEPPPPSSGSGSTTLRRKCQPRHRCASTNVSVSSIMRPSRYSLSSSISSSGHSVASEVAADNAAATNVFTDKVSKMRRRASLTSASMHSYFLSPSNPPLNDSQRRPSCSSLDLQWVASGVDFSSSVEVYVFRK